jgi:hypothetical protein
MVNGLYSSFMTCPIECECISIILLIGIDHATLYTLWECFVFIQLTQGYLAFGTLPIVSTGHKDLLGVVANKNSQDWVALLPDTIPAPHFNTIFAI